MIHGNCQKILLSTHGQHEGREICIPRGHVSVPSFTNSAKGKDSVVPWRREAGVLLRHDRILTPARVRGLRRSCAPAWSATSWSHMVPAAVSW